MDGACSTKGETRNAYKILVGKPEEKSPLGTSRHKWEDNVRMDLREIGEKVWNGYVWFRIESSGELL
jgi:hypothetical protein